MCDDPRIVSSTPIHDAASVVISAWPCLKGKAMAFPPKDQFPTRAEVLASVPADCFKKDTV